MVSDRVYLVKIIYKFTLKNRIMRLKLKLFVFYQFLVDAIDESEDNVISHELLTSDSG